MKIQLSVTSIYKLPGRLCIACHIYLIHVRVLYSTLSNWCMVHNMDGCIHGIHPLPGSQIGLKTVIADDDLKVSIYYLECLAQATYLIQHEDKALIVDPRRDVDAYLQV